MSNSHQRIPRLGHAFCRKDHDHEDDELRLFLEFCNGDASWRPRPPRDPEAVQRAEAILAHLDEPCDPRPIYAYLGNLQPAMGQMGLIVRTSWANHATGVSRCDTGGLAGGHGRFQHVPEDQREAQLRAVSTCGDCDVPLVEGGWRDEAFVEIERSYDTLNDYLQGVPPNISRWPGSDPRVACIQPTPPPTLDRRLWTWELRIPTSFQPDEVVRVVMTQDAYAAMEELIVDEGYDAPPTDMHIIAAPRDAQPFDLPEVIRAFIP